VKMKRITLLGATGSIGKNVIEVVKQFSDRYEIVGLAAGTNIALLADQIRQCQPRIVSVLNEGYAESLQKELADDWSGDLCWGTEGNVKVAEISEADFTVSAIVGAAGLLPTLAAIEAGKDIGLANKETLVMAGKYVMDAVKAKGVQLLPIDSEHSAIFQALEGGRKVDVDKIILTASGGPFRQKSIQELAKVSPEEAMNHPNWSMGPKISIDSATLMNKGLEVIEARWLFDIDIDRIEVLVHPQSIVHSLVEFQDGSVLAQLGIPDMRIPIAYALSYPERHPLGLNPLKLSECSNLEFHDPEYSRFPALHLAFDAIEQGGVLPAVLNGANEIAVDAFLNSRIDFPAIADTVAQTMALVKEGSEDSLEDILTADRRAREEARRIIKKVQSGKEIS
jgi:1-deoxy-D-xylulose-5-phosphate reductoisomerase